MIDFQVSQSLPVTLQGESRLKKSSPQSRGVLYMERRYLHSARRGRERQAKCCLSEMLVTKGVLSLGGICLY